MHKVADVFSQAMSTAVVQAVHQEVALPVGIDFTESLDLNQQGPLLH